MTAIELETEIKYDAAGGFVMPKLDELPAVAAVRHASEEHLEAKYFDTDDLRLIRAGITLRRRTGGHDDGWHLKLPAGADRRREMRMPLAAGDGQVPARLTELIRA